MEFVGYTMDYQHSSAKFYMTGRQGVYEVLNYCELADVDLTASSKFNAESTTHTKPSSETSAGKDQRRVHPSHKTKR